MSAHVDRAQIERLVRSALHGSASAAMEPAAQVGPILLAPDSGVGSAPYVDAQALKKMVAATPARIAVGRAGTRYRTTTLLRFRADHAAAKDAVMSEVDPAVIAQLGLTELTTRAPDKRVFLERPDAGRALSDESVEKLKSCIHGAQVQICHGDGLSPAALNAHLVTFHTALIAALARRGLRIGTPLFVRRSRVKVMDQIAQLLDAEACIFTCGERPGLGFSDSMSAYYIYRPKSGATDADREVISNINPRGLPPAQAAEAVADACVRITTAKKSGVAYGVGA